MPLPGLTMPFVPARTLLPDPGAGNADGWTAILHHFDSNVVDSNTMGIPAAWTNNGVAWYGGKFGNCAGSTSGINAQTTSGYNGHLIGTKDFTIDFWHQHTSTLPSTAYAAVPAAGMCCMMCHHLNWHCGFGKTGAAYTLGFGVRAPNAAVFNSDPFTTQMDPSNFHHFAITRSGTTIRFFIDGVPFGERTMTAAEANLPVGLNNIQVCNGWDASVANNCPQNGYLDEIRLSIGICRWTKAFTPPTAAYVSGLGGNDSFTKLLMHCNGQANSFIDSAVPAHAMTANGAVTHGTTAKFGNGSMSCNGSSSYVNSTTTPADWDFGTGDFTVDCQANITAYSTTFGHFVNAYTSLNDIWRLYADPTGKASFDLITGGVSRVALKSSAALPLGVWAHVAAVRYGNIFTLYVDGQAVATTNYTGASAPTTGIVCGSSSGASAATTLNGFLDEIRVSKGIARWTNNFIPPTSGYW